MNSPEDHSTVGQPSVDVRLPALSGREELRPSGRVYLGNLSYIKTMLFRVGGEYRPSSRHPQLGYPFFSLQPAGHHCRGIRLFCFIPRTRSLSYCQFNGPSRIPNGLFQRPTGTLDPKDALLFSLARSCSPVSCLRSHSDDPRDWRTRRSQPSGHLSGRPKLDCHHIDRLLIHLPCANKMPRIRINTLLPISQPMET
jgi:hypothetical protein